MAHTFGDKGFASKTGMIEMNAGFTVIRKEGVIMTTT